MKERFTLAEIAAALGKAKSSIAERAKRESWPYIEQTVRGGKQRLFPLDTLPADVCRALVVRGLGASSALPQPAVSSAAGASPAGASSHAPAALFAEERIASAWARYETVGERLQQRAQRAAAALDAVQRLARQGLALMEARAAVAAELKREQMPGGSVPSLCRWAAAVAGAPRADWPALLLPAYAGGNNEADCDPQAWDWYKGQYLNREQPSHRDTYRRLQEMAPRHGWKIPCARTLARRLDAQVNRVTQIILREGPEAAARLLPTRQRDALAFAVGEAVNGDGLKFDRLWVKFEDGEILNTATAWIWQDIHSRRLIAWRLGKTENTDVFRLATYDLTGVCAPEHVWMDNTRVAANKLMTAGAPGRHRFRHDPEDGLGLLLMLGMEPHFTNPDKESGNPGAKPIERAFGIGGLHEKVATHPRIIAAGGYSQATAIDVALLREVIGEEVARHNAQSGRRTQACRGVLSFDQAWQAGLQQRPPRVLSDVQRRLLLMGREVVRAAANNGELRIEAGRGRYAKNAYWCEHLPQYAGKKLAVHFDPDNLAAGAHIYTLDGRYLFSAEHIARGAFNDQQTGREWSKFRRRVAKANKIAAHNETRMDALERDALYQAARPAPTPGTPATAPSTVVRPVFNQVPNPGRDALRRTGTDDLPSREDKLGDLLERIQQRRLNDQL